MVSKIGNNLTSLCFLPSGRLVCYRAGKLYMLENSTKIGAYSIFGSFRECILGRINFFNRFFRLGIRSAISMDENNILFSIKNIIYEYSFQNQEKSKGFVLPVGIRPLNFTKIEGITRFMDGLVFGGYLGNANKSPVHIYRRRAVDSWEIIYTFKSGEINHIHNIVPDQYRDCVWIFTGDFDDSAAIWKATDNFKKIEKVFSNDQKYRGCVAFALQEGLLYATDSPFMPNTIRLVTINQKNEYKNVSVCNINGSCIYGCQVGKKFVFSSTVEPDGRKASLYNYLFNYSIGSGIKDRYSYLYVGTLSNGFKSVFRVKKDYLPFIFQFGTIKFPSGFNNSSLLYFQPIATKHDMQLLSIKL